MKKIILSVGMALTLNNAFAQWVTKTIDNGFDEPTKIAYTEDGQRPFLKLERFESAGVLMMGGVYFCSNPVFIELSFQVNGVNKKYGRIANVNEDQNRAFITWDIKNEDFISDFKNATSVKLRITDTDECNDGQIYTFKMSGSTASINFVTTP
jgi:hypothetical protein